MGKPEPGYLVKLVVITWRVSRASRCSMHPFKGRGRRDRRPKATEKIGGGWYCADCAARTRAFLASLGVR